MKLVGCVAGPFQTNCWMVINSETASVTVIDPGYGAAKIVDDYCQEQQLTVGEILLTHGHIDHMRDAGVLATTHGCTVSIHPDDAFMLTDPSGGVSSQAMALHDVGSMVKVPADSLQQLTHEQQITIGEEQFTVRHAPGHSPGSVLLVGEEICFSGDVLFKGSIGRTDLPGSDWSAMEQTLANQVLTLPDNLMILPGHGPTTKMQAERLGNPYLRKYQS
ncbi:MBL fold metallo-hydrolase [Corynebacterium choanae]|nr:MBL fold metallo-hydrolase [Corynebacterium choanae]